MTCGTASSKLSSTNTSWVADTHIDLLAKEAFRVVLSFLFFIPPGLEPFRLLSLIEVHIATSLESHPFDAMVLFDLIKP